MASQCLNDLSPKMGRLINDMSNGVIPSKLVDQKSKFIFKYFFNLKQKF